MVRAVFASSNSTVKLFPRPLSGILCLGQYSFLFVFLRNKSSFARQLPLSEPLGKVLRLGFFGPRLAIQPLQSSGFWLAFKVPMPRAFIRHLTNKSIGDLARDASLPPQNVNRGNVR